MNNSLQPGLTNELTVEVDDSMSPPHLPAKVLSTPNMIQLIEQACLLCAQPHLDDNETTVGTHVCVSHSGAARAGENVTISVRLKEIEKRRLRFETRVEAPKGVISEGTHERAVVDLNRMRGSA